ncbi:MAG: efflux RND transporter periplasmic adaptor subunit [Acidobacteriota bacterium]
MIKNLITSLLMTLVLLAGFLAYFSSRQGAWLRERLSQQHDLIPVRGEAGEVEYWTCTMHPSVKMKNPGTCPICSMNLVPVKKKKRVQPPRLSEPARLDRATGVQTEGDASVFEVDPRRQQLINVQTSVVERRRLEKSIRTVAILELDERGITKVHAKIEGWIDRVFVDFTLEHVKKGDPLFSIYSPRLVSTQEEYLLAVRTAQSLGGSPFDFVSNGARSLLEATRRRLLLFDVTEAQIQELEQSGEVKKTLIIYSPVSGHVIEKNAFENMRVTPDTTLYSVADHARIWAQVKIYENDIAQVHLGQTVTMTMSSFPGRVFHGKISYLYPHLDPTTRTLEARLEFPNPNLLLKPQMYANIEIHVPLGQHLAVPESAVLRTGTRDLVFVDLGGGSMRLRQVEIGARAGGYYKVLRGLRAGERVVSSANFLIDAESKVQGVEASWETPKPATERAPGGRKE